MEFGLHLPNAGPFASGRDIVRIAQEAEDLGFGSVWLFDHIFTPVELDSKYPYTADGSYLLTPDMPFYDVVAVMGAIAGATERIRFGTRVMIPTYRHPVVLANELASIDAIAGGRMLLGVGAGWMAEEFDACDVPLDERFARLDEHIALMRNAWANETASFEGRFYSHVAAGFAPLPPNGSIPIILGGHGDAALRRTAKWGDGWAVATAGTVAFEDVADAIGERLDTLRRFCDEEGRPFEDLLLVGQAPLNIDADVLKAQADMGIDIVDLLWFGTTEDTLEQAKKFMDEVAPKV
jgi:probable F420-dependent oxidoreductase